MRLNPTHKFKLYELDRLNCKQFRFLAIVGVNLRAIDVLAGVLPYPMKHFYLSKNNWYKGRTIWLLRGRLGLEDFALAIFFFPLTNRAELAMHEFFLLWRLQDFFF